MTKHKKCSMCHGLGKLIQVEEGKNNRPRPIEITCPLCHGTGFEAK